MPATARCKCSREGPRGGAAGGASEGPTAPRDPFLDPFLQPELRTQSGTWGTPGQGGADCGAAEVRAAQGVSACPLDPPLSLCVEDMGPAGSEATSADEGSVAEGPVRTVGLLESLWVLSLLSEVADSWVSPEGSERKTGTCSHG